MIRNIFLSVFMLCGVSSVSSACLWDSDTLAQEAKGLPGVVEVLVGFYPQNPPRFYEMRLERVLPLIEADPAVLELYDDASVAYDKLGEHDAAIAMMASKRAALDLYAEGDPVRIEHEYRYLANLGTHHAHRWLASTDRESDLSDLQQARDLIAAAIELNPDAHFGREFVQLRLLDVLLLRWTTGSEEFERDEQWERYEAAMDRLVIYNQDREHFEQVVEGYIGLITLGQASQSIDVHMALSRAFTMKRKASVVQLAILRANELYRDGARSLFEKRFDPRLDGDLYRPMGLYDRISEQNKKYFAYARFIAVEAAENRTRYMTMRFNRGEHPDTHPDFWKDYEQPRLPPLPNGLLGTGIVWEHLETRVILGGVLLSSLVVFGYMVGRWRLRRRHQRPIAAV